MLNELNYRGQEKELLLNTRCFLRTKPGYKINKTSLRPQGTTSQGNVNNAIHDSQSATEAQTWGIHSPIWVLEKAYHKRGVNRVLVTTTSLIYKDQTQVTWPCGQKTSPEKRPGFLCMGNPCCRGHRCSAVHGGLRKEPPCSKGSRTCFATILICDLG